MRLIFTILFLFSVAYGQTNYYVSNSGSDSNDGLTTGTSWATIAKVNVTVTNGDSVFFNKGDSWNGKLIVPASNIYFGSYGTGNKPIITGLKSVTLTNTSGNLWSATISDAVANENVITIGGVAKAKGRYPNAGSYLLTSHTLANTKDTIHTGLTGTPDYTGKEIVIQSQPWVWDISKVQTQSSGTLTISPQTTYTAGRDVNYFFQNDISFLDVQNEWSCDSNKLLTVYSPSDSVKYSNIDTLVFLNNKKNVTFDGFNFSGANSIAINSDTSKYLTVKNCTFSDNGNGIVGTVTTHAAINNDSIVNTLTNGIQLFTAGTLLNSCDSLNISNNYVSKTSLYPGMCKTANGSSVAIYTGGISDTISNNRIDSSGYVGIFWAGRRNLIKNNYITNFVFMKDDGGGIYTGLGGVSDGEYDSASFVTGNIISGGIGKLVNKIAPAIYMDGGTRHVTANDNTVNDCSYAGVLLHINSYINLYDNTIVDSTGTCLYVIAGSGGSGSATRNITYQKTVNGSYFNMSISAPAITIPDSNYYASKAEDTSIINGQAGKNYTLAQWKVFSTYDAHSNGNPTGITSDLPILYINPTTSDSTIYLTGLYYDAKGTPYNNSITLHPFKSALLFKSASEVPVTPSERSIGNLLIK